MKNAILFLILIFTIGLKAQNFNKSDFKKTEWFADNQNRNFYESDTIILTRILSFNNEKEKLNEIYIKLQKNENGDITELNFKNCGKLIVQDVYVENWSYTKFVGKWKWKFDSKKQILNIYFKRKIHSSFRVESKKRERIIWNKSEIDLIDIYLIRLKK